MLQVHLFQHNKLSLQNLNLLKNIITIYQMISTMHTYVQEYYKAKNKNKIKTFFYLPYDRIINTKICLNNAIRSDTSS